MSGNPQSFSMSCRTLLITLVHAVFLVSWFIPAARAQVPIVAGGESRAALRISPEPGELTQLAGRELADYVRKLSGVSLPKLEPNESGKEGQSWIFLGETGKQGVLAEALQANGGLADALKPEGFVLRTGMWQNRPVVIVAGADDAGVLYGVYELLTRLGVTFRLTGDILPAKQADLAVPNVNARMEPALKRRGFLFPVNFDNASSYSWSDYETMLDQMARLKCNYLQFWWFSFQPWLTYSYKGEPALFGDLARKESGFQSWAYGGFGSRTIEHVRVGRDHFAKRPRLAPLEMQKVETPEEALRISEDLLRRIIAHAAKRNIKVWLVVEMASLPPNLARHGETVGDLPFDYLFGTFLHPLDPVNREIQVNRLQALAKTYPGAEGVFLNFAELYPDLKSENHRAFLQQKRAEFYELRRLSIPWLTALASIYLVRVEQVVDANIGDLSLFEYLLQKRDELLPDLKLGLMTVGRGYGLPFFDKRLPRSIPFASLESSGVWTMTGMPMEYFGGMGERERVIQPRVDDDFDMLGMQFSVRQYAEKDRVFVDGMKHGLSGFAGQVERARGTEFNSSFLSEAAWNPELTPEEFYRGTTERMFGKDAGADMLRALLKLEENQQYLGYYNFDGGYGTLPCCGAVREIFAAYKYARQKNPYAGATTAAWTNLVTIAPESISRREGSIRLLNEALELMRGASAKVAPGGQSELTYLVNRTEVLRDTFAGLNTFRRAMVSFDEAFRAKPKVEPDQFLGLLESSLAIARDAQTQLVAATRKFSERIDHVSDLAVLYHLNARILLGLEYGILHLENVVNYHRGKPYLKSVPFEQLFPLRPDRGGE
jgi:hypothetical protein